MEPRRFDARDNRDAQASEARAYDLGCLEVWGGNTAIDSSVCVTGLDIWAWSRPAEQDSGGDLYFVTMCACAEVSRLLLADVSGHGASAGRVAGRLTRLLRRYINQPDQTRLAEALNARLDSLRRDGKFATAVLATFLPQSRQLAICNAGHPAPLIYRAADDAWQALGVDTTTDDHAYQNLPLGITADVGYHQQTIQLEPGDSVLFYTDGLTEVWDRRQRMLGREGLRRLAAQADPARPGQFMAELRGLVRNYRRDREAPFEDDATALLLRANGGQPRPLPRTQKLKNLVRMLGLKP